MPPYSGESSDATYTFDTFVFDINLQDPTLSSESEGEITVDWSTFNFIFQFNYHVCATSWPNPCENGYIQIYTTDMSVTLSTDLAVAFTGPTVSLTSTSVALNFNNDIDINVQCTDTFCLIPTSDIANDVGNQFVQIFTAGLQTAINNAAATMFDTISTTVSVPSLNLALQLQGQFALFPATSPNLVLYMEGLFDPNGQQITPPFTPEVSPPDSVFASPSSQFEIVFTDYLIKTAVWAMNILGQFNKTITNSDLPSNSPVHLLTNDPTMQSAVPGVKAYPNCDINVQVSLYNISSVDITGNPGIILSNAISADFFITNSTFNMYAWTLIVGVDVTDTMSASFNSTINEIQIDNALSGWEVDVQLLDSAVGSVSTGFFKFVITVVLSSGGFEVPSVPIPPPTDFNVGTPAYTEGVGYGFVGTTLEYNVDVPVVTCSESADVCPEGNTCCGWGCCTLPSASCCPEAGCCPEGSECVEGGCEGAEAAFFDYYHYK